MVFSYSLKGAVRIASPPHHFGAFIIYRILEIIETMWIQARSWKEKPTVFTLSRPCCHPKFVQNSNSWLRNKNGNDKRAGRFWKFAFRRSVVPIRPTNRWNEIRILYISARMKLFSVYTETFKCLTVASTHENYLNTVGRSFTWATKCF